MYDATTRATYAELFKTAQTTVPGLVRESLVKAAAKEPAVSTALANNGSR